MKRFHIPRLICLLGTLVLAASAAFAQQEEQAARSVPADAIVYLSADVLGMVQFWNQVKDSTLGKLLAGAMQKKDAKPGDQGDAKKEDAKSSDQGESFAQTLAMLQQAFQGRVSIALRDGKLVPGQTPSLLAVLPTKGQQEAQALVTVLQMKLKAEGKVEIATREYQGVTITTLSGAKMKTPVSYALLNGSLLAATQPEWLEKALDATAGRAPGLAANGKFEQIRARVAGMGTSQAWFWLDPIRYNAFILDAAQEAAKKQAAQKAEAEANAAANADEKPAAKPPVNLAALQPMMAASDGVGGRLQLSLQGIALEGIATLNGENELGRKLLAQQGSPLQSAALTSGNAVLYVGFNYLPLALDVLRSISGAVGGNTPEMLGTLSKTFEQATSLKLKEDLGNYIGAEVALTLNDIPADMKSFPVLFYLQTTNKPALGKSLQKLRTRLAQTMQLQFVQKDLPQGRIYSIAPEVLPLPVTPGWTFANDFLVIGSTPEAMKSPLFLAKGTGTALAAMPDYQRAAGAGNKQLLSMFYLNFSKLTALADKLSAKKKDGAAAANAENVKQALQLLHTLSASQYMEQGAVAFRAELAADFTK